MQPDKLLTELEKLIARQETRMREVEQDLSRLRGLRNAVEGLKPQEAIRIQVGGTKTHFEMVVDFFRKHGNHPLSLRDLATATGIARNSLTQLVYQSHKESFVSVDSPGYQKRKLWSLTEEALRGVVQALPHSLFAGTGDLEGLSAKECCVRILEEWGNEPTNVLTMAREALRRGYSGGAEGSEDDVLMTTAKSFWARLGRDVRFVEVRPQVFVLKTVQGQPPKTPTSEAEDKVRSIEAEEEDQESE